MMLSDQLTRLFRHHLFSLLAVGVIALLMAGYLIFGLAVIAPQRQQQTALRQQKATAVSQLAELQSLPPLTGSDGTDADAAQRQLVAAAALFLTENEAAALLNTLNQVAAESGVTIIDLQALPAADIEAKSVYDVRPFQVLAEGEVMRLLDFVARMRETAVFSVQLSNLVLVEASPTATLTFDLTLYTSPYASETALLNLPALPTPLPVVTAVAPQSPDRDTLTAQLDQAWQDEAWPAVIDALKALLAISPDDLALLEKLYAAHVNYGFQLQSQGSNDAARDQFALALEVNPEGAEANQALAALDNTSP